MDDKLKGMRIGERINYLSFASVFRPLAWVQVYQDL
jgi:hypothetical protein